MYNPSKIHVTVATHSPYLTKTKTTTRMIFRSALRWSTVTALWEDRVLCHTHKTPTPTTFIGDDPVLYVTRTFFGVILFYGPKWIDVPVHMYAFDIKQDHPKRSTDEDQGKRSRVLRSWYTQVNLFLSNHFKRYRCHNRTQKKTKEPHIRAQHSKKYGS